jgi:LacI family transcriptional regulator
MRELAREGYLERKAGGGSFVKYREAIPDSHLCSEIIIASKSLDYEIDNNPCSWFVWHEVQRGIVNSCKSSVGIISENDLNNRVSVGFKQAVILFSSELKTVDRLKKLNVPCVFINNRFWEELSENAVNLDRMSGTRDAMSYLFDDLRHKQIALISRDYPSHAQRIAAYYAAHVSRGLEVDDKLVVKVKGGDESSRYFAMKTLIESGVDFSAVFVSTDEKAKGVYSAAKEAGLSIPGDISVVGFDDIPEASRMSPPLTTVSGNYYDLGSAAMKLLYEILKKGCNLPSVVVKTTLRIRESVGVAVKSQL